MSRGWEEREAAWKAWLSTHSIGDQEPYAFEHHCGGIGTPNSDELSFTVCPGCGFELSRPETECTPLYRRPCDCTWITVHDYGGRSELLRATFCPAHQPPPTPIEEARAEVEQIAAQHFGP